MNAVPSIQELEQRAATFARARGGVIAALVVVAIIMISCADARRASEADGEIRVLERQTAAAQKVRHAATLAAIEAKRQLAIEKARADSLEAVSRAAKVESDRLGQLVQIASETTLVAAITPDSTIHVTVPRVVTTYIRALYATIQAQDAALAARDTQVVRADTVIVVQDRVVAVDSTVIDTQAETVHQEKRARPRLGFLSGLATGGVLALIVHFLL